MDYKECRFGNHNPMSICEKCPIQNNCPAEEIKKEILQND